MPFCLKHFSRNSSMMSTMQMSITMHQENPILEHIVKSSNSENDGRNPPSTLHTCASMLWEKTAVSPLKGSQHEVSPSKGTHCKVLMPKGETPIPCHAMHHPGNMMTDSNASKTLSKKTLNPSMGDALPPPSSKENRLSSWTTLPLCIHVMCSHMHTQHSKDPQLVCYQPLSASMSQWSLHNDPAHS